MFFLINNYKPIKPFDLRISFNIFLIRLMNLLLLSIYIFISFSVVYLVYLFLPGLISFFTGIFLSKFLPAIMLLLLIAFITWFLLYTKARDYRLGEISMNSFSKEEVNIYNSNIDKKDNEKTLNNLILEKIVLEINKANSEITKSNKEMINDLKAEFVQNSNETNENLKRINKIVEDAIVENQKNSEKLSIKIKKVEELSIKTQKKVGEIITETRSNPDEIIKGIASKINQLNLESIDFEELKRFFVTDRRKMGLAKIAGIGDIEKKINILENDLRRAKNEPDSNIEINKKFLSLLSIQLKKIYQSEIDLWGKERILKVRDFLSSLIWSYISSKTSPLLLITDNMFQMEKSDISLKEESEKSLLNRI